MSLYELNTGGFFQVGSQLGRLLTCSRQNILIEAKGKNLIEWKYETVAEKYESMYEIEWYT